MPDDDPKPELLAPAGDAESLAAALAAGADAVYLGLTSLNARRGAANFAPDALPDAVAQAHDAGARVHLTLNIDLNQREVGHAARILTLAREAGVDAVLVRDPALLALRSAFAETAWHLSTQAAVANAAGVRQAGALGADRVVLARELTLAEIRAASSVEGVETEVFVQGALCFGASGRCLLSSWGGGRSGNRGVCASPCRVAWTADRRDAGRPFSMHDLSLLHRIPALREAGVRCLKIEGRLKTADWVRRAVQCYRAVLDGTPPEEVADLAASLGEYTGRRFTSGYLDADRADMAGGSGRAADAARRDAPRRAAADASRAAGSRMEEDAPRGDAERANASDAARPSPSGESGEGAYGLRLETASGRLVCTCAAEGVEESWTLPLTVVRRPKKAMTLAALGEAIGGMTIQHRRLEDFHTDDPERLVPPKTANAVTDRLSAALHRAGRPAPRTVRIDLPAAVRETLDPGEPHPANTRALGDPPDRARLDARQIDAAKNLPEPDFVVEGLDAKRLRAWAERVGPDRLVAALPAVWCEDETDRVRALIDAAGGAGVAVEANDWGGARLAADADAPRIAGPGLGVLNAAAARALGALGFAAVTASVEADRRNLEELSAACPVPLQILVYGRPVLAVTRAELPADLARVREFADERGIRLAPGRGGGGRTRLRAATPFDLTDVTNRRIRAHRLAADLAGEADPAGAWYGLGRRQRRAFRFNYDRTLH